jgi:DNA recombination protein RmuC
MSISFELVVGLFIGFCLGALLLWMWMRTWISPQELQGAFVARSQVELLELDLQKQKQQKLELHAELAGANVQSDLLAQQLSELQLELSSLREKSSIAQQKEQAASAELEHLQTRLTQQQSDFKRLHEQSREEFANISNKLLQSSGAALREEHTRSLKSLLDPVRTKLHEFQEQVDRKFSEESKDKAALKTQIEHLTTLNQDLSREAKQLTQALKGDSKTQGDWGELQLERLLEAAGLQADTHFTTQGSFRNATGQQQRPDCLIHLPGDRCLVVDSKVSLTAYERFCGSEIEEEQKRHLRDHVLSLRTHVKQLSAKRYHDLYQINCPDYVLLFVPLEPAFILAAKEYPSLFTDALAANVVLVSPSTLLATMRTVSYIWQQEDQRENAQQIAAVGKKLYDKFVGFVEDMNGVGHQLDKAQDSYAKAMNKLSRSPKQATTLISHARELKALGISTTKELDSSEN